MRDVKSRAGTVRAERAAETRRRIEAAARALFALRGYGATTLREIADEAGVAVQTVYAVYRSKASILGALRDGLRDEPEAVAAYRTALAEPDPRRSLEHFARALRIRWSNGHDIVTIHVEAASVDPAIRADLVRLMETRRGGLFGLARSLAAKPGGPGDIDRTVAVLDALTLPEVYAQLVVTNGWTPDAYETWLAGELRHAVLERAAE